MYIELISRYNSFWNITSLQLKRRYRI